MGETGKTEKARQNENEQKLNKTSLVFSRGRHLDNLTKITERGDHFLAPKLRFPPSTAGNVVLKRE
jgi:hypothetical protein